MLELLGAGLSLAETRTLGVEQLLCLLHHIRLDTGLRELDAEAGRIASLPFAEAAGQQRLLVAVDHRRSAMLDRFYHDYGSNDQ